MDTDSFTIYIKRNDVNKDIAKYVETRFDTSNYELDTSLPKGKIKKTMKGLINKINWINER